MPFAIESDNIVLQIGALNSATWSTETVRDLRTRYGTPAEKILADVVASIIMFNIRSFDLLKTDKASLQIGKFNFSWSMEPLQDLLSTRNYPAEKTIADMIAQEIKNAIDKEIQDLEDLSTLTPLTPEKNCKNKILPRSIVEDWQVSRFD